jgi:hypothetical protein
MRRKAVNEATVLITGFYQSPTASAKGTKGLPFREIEPIEVLMESLFGLLSTLELHSRLLNVRIVRESF